MAVASAAAQITSITDHRPPKHGGRSKSSKGRHLKLYMHPPSIPTKFQTFCYEDREEKGFGSTATRFDKRMDELPGPGYYKTKLPDDVYTTTSTQKGLNGFASKAKRFDPSTDTHIPSPTIYTPRTPTYSHSLAHNPSPAFRARYAITVESPVLPAWGARFERETPGPGYYEVEKREGMKNGMAVFKSRSGRSLMNEPGATPGWDAPAPGEYQVHEEAVTKSIPAAVAAFKAVPRGGLIPKQLLNNPGPGAYELKAENDQTYPTHRRRLTYRPLHEIPQPKPPRPLPAPGTYNISPAAEHISSVRKPPDQRSVFISKSPRFNMEKKDGPGASYYCPIWDKGPRSFRLNLEGLWA